MEAQILVFKLHSRRGVKLPALQPSLRPPYWFSSVDAGVTEFYLDEDIREGIAKANWKTIS